MTTVVRGANSGNSSATCSHVQTLRGALLLLPRSDTAADWVLPVFSGHRSGLPAATFSSTQTTMVRTLLFGFSSRNLKHKCGEGWWVRRRNASRKNHKKAKKATLMAEAPRKGDMLLLGEVAHMGHLKHSSHSPVLLLPPSPWKPSEPSTQPCRVIQSVQPQKAWPSRWTFPFCLQTRAPGHSSLLNYQNNSLHPRQKDECPEEVVPRLVPLRPGQSGVT